MTGGEGSRGEGGTGDFEPRVTTFLETTQDRSGDFYGRLIGIRQQRNALLGVPKTNCFANLFILNFVET